jgi:hypothetical protein
MVFLYKTTPYHAHFVCFLTISKLAPCHAVQAVSARVAESTNNNQFGEHGPAASVPERHVIEILQ